MQSSSQLASLKSCAAVVTGVLQLQHNGVLTVEGAPAISLTAAAQRRLCPDRSCTHEQA